MGIINIGKIKQGNIVLEENLMREGIWINFSSKRLWLEWNEKELVWTGKHHKKGMSPLANKTVVREKKLLEAIKQLDKYYRNEVDIVTGVVD